MAVALGVGAVVAVPAPWRWVALGVAALTGAWPSRAGRWAAGAAGERATARALAGIERRGWTVLHDVRPPGKRWNVDHLLIGPGGVVIVETKQWREPVRTLRRHPKVLEEHVGWQVEAVQRLLGTDHVHGFLCVHGARVRRLRRSTPVGDGRHLRRWLRRLPRVLDEGGSGDVTRSARRTFE